MKTVVGLFDTYAHAQRAAQNLENTGISHNDISLLASNETQQFGQNPTNTTAPVPTNMATATVVDAEVGAGIGGVLGLLAGASLFVIPGLGFIAGAGWLAGLLTGAAIGGVAGGLIGALTHVGVPAEDAAYYNEGVRRGGTLVTVRAEDSNAAQVAQILSADGAVNIEERAAQWRQDGFIPPSTTGAGTTLGHEARNAAYNPTATVERTEGSLPGIQTGGRAVDGSGAPDTRGITEKVADTVTGNRVDDKTGRPV